MNPWVIGILGLLISMLPSVYFYTQLSPLRKKLQLAEKGKERSEKAYNEAQAELEDKDLEIDTTYNKLTELENQYSREIENLKQSYKADIEKIQAKLEAKNQKIIETNSIALKDLTNQVQSLEVIRDELQARINEIEKKLTEDIEEKLSKEIELETEIVEIDQNLNRLYSYILEGFQKIPYFYDQQNHSTFGSYLQSLKNSAKQLWRSYRSDQVTVNYSDPLTQAAYMIRYYPNYAGLTFRVLENLKEQKPNILGEKVSNKIQACFFGAGPCPEVVGLSHFLYNNYPEVNTLIANVFDINSDGWTPSRNLTRDLIIPHYLQGSLQLNSYQLDLCKADSLEDILGIIKNSSLFIFQNCLNELYHRGAVKSNLDFLLQEIPLNSSIIIIDLSSYRQNCSIVDQLQKQVNQQEFEVYHQQKTWIFDHLIPIPQVVRECLLTGENQLIPRKKISSVFIIMQKSSFKHDKKQDSIEVSKSAKPKRKVQNKPQQTAQKVYSIEGIQKTYARAYTPWTKKDDERLKQRYNQGAGINDLVKEFQRQPGGIRSRLTKLGLLS